MFKKIVAAALATVAVTASAGVAFAASYGGEINVSAHPNSYYHTCKVDGCSHYADKKYLSLNAEGKWGYVYARTSDHWDSYKYISITTYGLRSDDTYYVIRTVNNSGTDLDISSPNTTIDGRVAKVVYNGQIFRTSERSSGILQKYLIGSFRSGCPVK